MSRMQRMEPSVFRPDCTPLYVQCSRCGRMRSATDVSCDMAGKPFTFYCAGDCAIKVILDDRAGERR